MTNLGMTEENILDPLLEGIIFVEMSIIVGYLSNNHIEKFNKPIINL